MSIFGQPAQQQPASTNLFGAASTNTQPAGGLFGAAQNTAQPAAPTTNLFGQPAQQQQQQTSLFGNTAAAPAAGSLFGGGAATGTGTSLFGAPQQPQQQPAAGGGLFGNTQTQTQQPAAGGGLFGSTTQQPAAGGGLFGSTTTQPAAGGGLFGSTNTGSGLFGAKPAGTAPLAPAPTVPATGGGLFGSTNTQQASTSNLFGQSTQTKPLFGAPTAPANAFGASTTNNTFGLSNNAPKPAFGLGATQTQAPLGASTLSTSALRTPAPAQPQADAQTQFARLNARIEEIANAWNPSSPQCRFQYVFYNQVNPQQVGMYGRPPNISETLWAKAVRDNPDPSILVPTVALSYDDVRTRVDGQSQQAADQVAKLNELKSRIADISTIQSTNHTRAARLAATHIQLYHRILQVAAHLHLLIPAVRGSAMRLEEEGMRAALEEVKAEVGIGGSGTGAGARGAAASAGRIRSKIAELWAVVGALSAARDAATGMAGQGEWKVVDEDGLARIAQILSEQQAGLAHLMKILQKDLKDLAVVLGKSRVEDGDEATDMWRSSRMR
ncbi:C2H2-type domain-containing protein [Mycena kentingensis (nom. inval.)]|nr:C2H2-type domain-containing protein [Mycena kentingensis (nom. inval.)]